MDATVAINESERPLADFAAKIRGWDTARLQAHYNGLCGAGGDRCRMLRAVINAELSARYGGKL